MYEKIAQRLLRYAVKNGIVKTEDIDLYCYAYVNLISQIVNWTSLLLLAGLFHAVPQMILYMVLFMPLRAFAGGYHSRDYLRCYLSSTLFQVLIMLAAPVAASAMIPLAVLGALFVSAAVIFVMAPVADKNKPLSDREQVRYRKVTLLILLVECIIILLPLFCNTAPIWILYMLCSPLSVALLLLLTRLQQKK